MSDPADPAISAFWAEYADSCGVGAEYSAWAFGADDDREQQTRLGRLVRDGPKRATTGRLADFAGEPLPLPGEHSVILDGGGSPLCIIVTTDVECRRFGDVGEEFAWTEGEGDRSLSYWRAGHEAFFARVGTPVDADTEMLLVWFDLVWPRPEPDPGGQ